MRTLSSSYKAILFIVLLASIVSVGLIDHATGTELAFSIFYLFPLGIAGWYIGWKTGVFLSLESAFCWYIADILARTVPYSNPWIPVWNAGVRLITFLAITILLAAIRKILNRESLYARIDHLTNAANARSFYETVDARISLLKRNQQPFSILYLDMDNLKPLNDSHGHAVGDKALHATVSTLKRTLRPSDIVARLGGDEFAVLLAEADAQSAERISTRVQSALRQNPGKLYRVTFSIGALTCSAAPKTVDELMEKADNLMYEAKRGGKDTIRLASYESVDQPALPADAASRGVK
jgi:diguanylate cyclase (GGDEF)-like protein